MRLAYLLNSYPMTSTTFIRREIDAIEARGVPVTRFAVRHWDVGLVEPADLAEQARTEYLLTGNVAGLLRSGLAELATNLPALLAVLPLWLRLLRAGGGVVRHVGYLLQAIHFRRRTARAGIGHVHVHFSTNATGVALLARRLGGAPYSFTVHGPDELVDPAANCLAEKVAGAAFVVAITDYCRGRIAAEAAADAGRIRVIACGLALDSVPVAPPVAADDHRLVCVGRLCANKGQVLIPAAVAALRAEFPGLVVELIGDGEDRPAIEAEIARLGIADMVVLSGWMDGARVLERIAAARALLLPSYAEGLPIVLMEALATGRAVVTTRIAGIPELVDEGCGWVIEPGDVPALTQAMRAALSATPAALAAMSAEGRARVAARHDIRMTAALLLEAMGQPRSPSSSGEG